MYKKYEKFNRVDFLDKQITLYLVDFECNLFAILEVLSNCLHAFCTMNLVPLTAFN